MLLGGYEMGWQGVLTRVPGETSVMSGWGVALYCRRQIRGILGMVKVTVRFNTVIGPVHEKVRRLIYL